MQWIHPRILMWVMVALIVAYSVIYLLDRQESQDAKTVDSVQLQLQQTVAYGVTLLKQPAGEIRSENIVNALKPALPKGVLLDKKLYLAFLSSHRGAQFLITNRGEVQLQSLTNFSRYGITQSRITRNNHWVLPALPHHE